MYLTQILHRQQLIHPDKTALVCKGQRLSYAQLIARVVRLACVLKVHGVRRGDRVAILSLNSPQYLQALWACWWIGAVACPVNTRWSAIEILFSLQDCAARLLLVDDAHLALLSAMRQADSGSPPLCPVLVMGEVDLADGSSREAWMKDAADLADLADLRAGGDELAVLLYTGGTTGRPKGVMLNHGNLYCAALARLADQPALGNSVVLLSTPLFHVAAITRVLPHLMAGATVVLVPHFRANEALDLIDGEGVTDLPLVPSMLQMLLDHPSFKPERLRSVQRMFYGAAPASQALVERTLRALPWAGFFQFYGMTESAAMGTMSRAADHEAAAWASGRASSAGLPCSAVEVRVVGATGQMLAPGEVGEIALRGPTIMAGYWNREEETTNALRNGWLYTGDAGYLDASGYLYVVDRIKDMIITGGENVYSAEVENALAQHPAVAQCSVIGVPSLRWGEAVHAVVVLHPNAQADDSELLAHCRMQLAAYKCPKSIEFASSMPLTAAGKVAKPALREAYLNRTEFRGGSLV